MNGSLFPSQINGCYSECQRDGLYVRQTCIAQVLAESFAVREMLDRAVEVGVRAFVMAEQVSYERQNMCEIQVITPADKRIGRIRELQNHQFAPVAQDAVHLTQAFVHIGEVTHAISAGNRIKRGVRIRHLLNAAVVEPHTLRVAGFDNFPLANLHHLAAQVDAYHLLRFLLTENFYGEVGRTDSYIQQFGCRPDGVNGMPAPATVDIKRQQMIEPVLGAGYAVKKLPYLLFFTIHDYIFRFVACKGTKKIQIMQILHDFLRNSCIFRKKIVIL